MFLFAADRPLYRHTGLAIAALQLFLFLFGLPPFQAGIWYQTEPILCTLLLLGTASAAWLALGVARNWLSWRRPPALFLCVLAWLGWQLLVTAFSVTPWRAWFGPTANGMGTASYALMVLMLLTYYPLLHTAGGKRLLLAMGFASLALLMPLHVLLAGHAWDPGKWADYTAFMGAYLWVGVLVGTPVSRRQLALLSAASLAVFYFSDNLSAIALMSAAVIISLIATQAPLPAALIKLRDGVSAWRIVACLICLTPLALVAAAQYVDTSAPDYWGKDVVESIEDSDSSLGARVRINKLAWAVMKNEPGYWLMGNGWGSISDDSFRHVFIEGIALFNGELMVENSVLLRYANFHTHNQPLEAFISFGLPGLLLWYAVVFAAILSVPREKFWHCVPMIAGICLVAGFWFELPQTMPYQALYFAALCSCAPRAASAAQPCRRRMLAAMFAGAAALCLWSACQQYAAVRYGERIYTELLRKGEEADIRDLSWLADDTKRDGDRLYNAMAGLMNRTTERLADGTATDNDRELFAQFLYAVQQASFTPNVGVRNRMMELNLLNYLFQGVDSPLFSSLKQEAKLYLPGAVMLQAQILPRREDLSAGFLAFLDAYAEGNVTLQVDILRRVLAIHPGHRSALWVMGGILAKDPASRDVGIEMQKDAYLQGVRSIFPLSQEELEHFYEQAPQLREE